MTSKEQTPRQRWLDRLDENAKPTEKGMRFSFTVYVYPDGQGSLYCLKPESKTIDEPGLRVGGVEPVVEAFRAVWEQASGHPK